MNTQIPMPVNGISTPFSIDENIAKMKQTLLKNIQRSAYVYRVDCGGCNGCEIEIFSTITPTFDAERFGIKVVASPRHADILLFTGAVTRAMRTPAMRAYQAAPDPKICISYGACGCGGGIFHDLYCVWGGNIANQFMAMMSEDDSVPFGVRLGEYLEREADPRLSEIVNRLHAISMPFSG
ncbi:hypothetical protein FXN58_07430 [Aggregatibacter actinomycetemcomitans]|uniref:NADH-quinone oxidoreductase subunit B family protein n=1 Tax=Aggregatibacter actinomycetemcomitans TaxID=714 RepID=UPI0011DCF21D|nr:hypothetical protein [Aggregatibacter actinomycetemcomitans]QEH45408.1 hypothetical protein FXN58_07430 [Aggregatibacter actinomycetemcomitans]